MNENQGKECVERLKSGAKELIDGIGTESEFEQEIIKMLYGFVRTGFLESRSKKGGAI